MLSGDVLGIPVQDWRSAEIMPQCAKRVMDLEG